MDLVFLSILLVEEFLSLFFFLNAMWYLLVHGESFSFCVCAFPVFFCPTIDLFCYWTNQAQT